MSTRLRAIIAASIAVVLLFALTVYARQSQTGARATWEYKDSCNLKESEMNKLGAEGWELVTAHSAGGTINCLVYKRAK